MSVCGVQTRQRWQNRESSRPECAGGGLGTARHNLRKSNTNILPANTVLVDLSGDEESILGRMKPKTRYNIRLALRRGVEVRSAGIEGLDTWYGLYTETTLRNGLHINWIEYFRNMFASRMDSGEDGVRVKLLIAYWENTPLAAMFLVLSSHRATYLYDARHDRLALQSEYPQFNRLSSDAFCESGLMRGYIFSQRRRSGSGSFSMA